MTRILTRKRAAAGDAAISAGCIVGGLHHLDKAWGIFAIALGCALLTVVLIELYLRPE